MASSASQIRRAKQLDALAALLPMASADRYAEVLTDADVATLKHLAHTRMGANRLCALAYLEVWCCAAIRHPLPQSADPELVLPLIAHHLWGPDQKAIDLAHRMPDDGVEELWERKILKVWGPHAPETIYWRHPNWSALHQWKGIDAPFGHLGIKQALRLAMEASPREPQGKSRRQATRDVLERLLATSSGSKAIDLRDRESS